MTTATPLSKPPTNPWVDWELKNHKPTDKRVSNPLMSSKHLPIEPKPTQYGGILFRSRLEARWAVFLDFTDNVLNWTYEPQTFTNAKGWSYTPDFLVKLCPWGGKKPTFENLYLEVKPTIISCEYRKFLREFAYRHKILIFVVQGDFYDLEAGIFSHIHLAGKRKSQPVTYDSVFANIGKGTYHAHHFRFDLEHK